MPDEGVSRGRSSQMSEVMPDVRGHARWRMVHQIAGLSGHEGNKGMLFGASFYSSFSITSHYMISIIQKGFTLPVLVIYKQTE